MAVSTRVEQAREEFHEKQKQLAAVMEMAWNAETKRHDFTRKDVQEKLGVSDKDEALRKVKERNAELDELGDELAQHEAKEVEARIGERERDRNTPVGGGEAVHPVGDDRPKSFGRMFVETKEYATGLLKERAVAISSKLDVSIKTLMSRTAGFAPESTRSDLVVPAVELSLAELLELIPVFNLTQANFVYMEETTRTHGAAETAEAGTYPESAFAFTQRTSPAEKVADSIPVTDEQLEDEDQVASLLDQRLRFGLRKRLANQILNGDGASPNLRGILNVVGIQTQALGADDHMSAAYKAITKVRFTGEAEPTAFVFHPNDWQKIVLGQATGGEFIWGHPSMAPMFRLWGLPVAVSTGIAEGTGLVGDFRNFTRLDERRGIEVQAGFVGTQFIEGKKTLRADMRTAFTVTRPAAMCTITGI